MTGPVIGPLVGIGLGLVIGFACRYFSIPSPAPPRIAGALLVMAMTVGYVSVDYLTGAPAW